MSSSRTYFQFHGFINMINSITSANTGRTGEAFAHSDSAIPIKTKESMSVGSCTVEIHYLGKIESKRNCPLSK